VTSARQDSPLPPEVQAQLATLVDRATAAFGPDLLSIVLFGSAAEGRLRATSDVNVMVVLARFDAARAEALRDPLRTAEAAVRLRAMFLLESEIQDAVEAFAQKFDDVLHRRQVLYGRDPFAAVAIPRAALKWRLRQTLLNLTLRLRQAYVVQGASEEQTALTLADAAGPLRAAAASLLELEGQPAASPREALERVAAATGVPELDAVVRLLSEIRETRRAPPGAAGPAVLHVIELARHLFDRAKALG
jgi:predicted nucleotidyltransferase